MCVLGVIYHAMSGPLHLWTRWINPGDQQEHERNKETSVRAAPLSREDSVDISKVMANASCGSITRLSMPFA